MSPYSAGVGVCLSADVLQKAPANVRNWIVQAAGLATAGTTEVASRSADEESSEKSTIGSHGLARLSQKSAQRFIEGLGDWSREVTTAIVKLPLDDNDNFSWAAFMKSLGLPINRPEKLKGVWTGVTKRVRTATGDKTSYLLGWPDWENLDWEDAVGQIDPVTYANLRKVLGIS